MSLISLNFDVNSIIFPKFDQGPFPKIAEKSPARLINLCPAFVLEIHLFCLLTMSHLTDCVSFIDSQCHM